MELLRFLYSYLAQSFEGKVVIYSCQLNAAEFNELLISELKPDFKEGPNLLTGQDFIGKVTSPTDFTFAYYGGVGTMWRYEVEGHIITIDDHTLVKFNIAPAKSYLWFSILALIPAIYFGYLLSEGHSFRLLALACVIVIPFTGVTQTFYPFFQRQYSIIVFAERFGLHKA